METERLLANKHLGQLLEGRFRIHNGIGEGGLSQVYSGTDEQEKRPIAIKILKAQFLSDEDAAGRFARETRAACLSHPHLVKVLDRGITPDGEPFIVMELLTGRTLTDMLEKCGALRLDRALTICRQTADAMAFAHAEGIVHRDIKPSNIFMVDNDAKSDYVKLLDFGVAKIIDQTGGFQTKVGETVGTPRYMSPEQVSGDRIDGRTDVYSLTLVLCEALTGQDVYDGDSPFEIMQKQLQAPPPDIRLIRPDLEFPEPVCELILRGMAKNPAQRFQTMHGFAMALRRLEEAYPYNRMAETWRKLKQRLFKSR